MVCATGESRRLGIDPNPRGSFGGHPPFPRFEFHLHSCNLGETQGKATTANLCTAYQTHVAFDVPAVRLD